jgi:hypothetical protein
MASTPRSTMDPIWQLRDSMTQSQSVGDVIARGVQLKYHEAVAVAQQLIASSAQPNIEAEAAAPLSIDRVRVTAEGLIECDASSIPPTVADIGLLLESMLPPTGTARTPGALRYAMARALQRVDAPPFDSLEALATTLTRHEQGPRDNVLRAIYARAAAAAPEIVATAGQPTDLERRRRSPSPAVLRRQLREADEKLFAQFAAQATRADAQDPPEIAPDIDTFTSHRLIDEPVVAHPFKPAAWALAGALSVFVAFGAGYAFVAGTTALRETERGNAPSAVTLTASPAPSADAPPPPPSNRRTIAKSEERDDLVRER